MIAEQLRKALRTLIWLPSYAVQRVARLPRSYRGPKHVVIAVADHFEPAHLHEGGFAPATEQELRIERWCDLYPRLMNGWRDEDGFPFRHTYFYPAEQYDPRLLTHLAAHCHEGWGEIEVQLHHGVESSDSSESTRHQLLTFRDRLVEHGCLSLWEGSNTPRYAFVHGNWALANSASGRFCGVDDEMRILSETGCYADFTLPSAPEPGQVSKINSIYECSLPMHQRAPHRRGRDLSVGRPPDRLPIIVQGPLGLRREHGRLPRIENGAINARIPQTARRFRFWVDAAIGVRGQPDWVFIKLHCHGMDTRERDIMLGPARTEFLRALTDEAKRLQVKLHFATAREMFNMILAACDGLSGSPGAYRDHRLRLIRSLERI